MTPFGPQDKANLFHTAPEAFHTLACVLITTALRAASQMQPNRPVLKRLHTSSRNSLLSHIATQFLLNFFAMSTWAIKKISIDLSIIF